VVGSALVIRPVWVIGRPGSYFWDTLFFGAQGKGVVWVGIPGARSSVIHQDDLVDAYTRAVERRSVVRGSAFDITYGFTRAPMTSSPRFV